MLSFDIFQIWPIFIALTDWTLSSVLILFATKFAELHCSLLSLEDWYLFIFHMHCFASENKLFQFSILYLADFNLAWFIEQWDYI